MLAAESCWPLKRSRPMDGRLEARARPLQRLERERARKICRRGKAARSNHAERRHRGHELRPVDEREPLLAGQPDRLEPDGTERGRAVQELPVDERLALPHQRERQVGERSEVAARTDGPARRHPRQHAAVQALDEKLDRGDVSAGEPLGQCVRPQQHRRADDIVGIRLADAAGMASEQPELQLLGELLRDVRRNELPEACVDAVRVLALHPVHELASGPHSDSRGVSQLGRSSLDGDLPHLREGQVLPRQHGGAGHSASLERSTFSRTPGRVDAGDVFSGVLGGPHDGGGNEPDELSSRAPRRLVPRPRHATRRTTSWSGARSTSITFMLTCTRPDPGSTVRSPARQACRRSTRGSPLRSHARRRRRRSQARRCRRRGTAARPRGRRQSAARCRAARRPASSSPASTRRRSSSSPPRRKNAGRRPAGELAVVEDRQAELAADSTRERPRGRDRSRHIARHERARAGRHRRRRRADGRPCARAGRPAPPPRRSPRAAIRRSLRRHPRA